MTPQRAAQAVLAAMPAIPSGRPAEAKLTAVAFAIDTDGTVTGVAAVEVAFAAGPQECRWLGSFAAEVVADPRSTWPGRSVSLLLTGDLPIVLGTIYGPPTEGV